MKKFMTAGLVLSALLAIVVFAVFQNTIVGEEDNLSGGVFSQEDQEALDQAFNDERLTYTNDTLGISFTYPKTFTVKERERLDGSIAEGDFYEGNAVNVTVYDENDNRVFHAVAVSEDFVLSVSEGCCYFFGTAVNVEQDLTGVASDISRVLQGVTDVTYIHVGERKSVGFLYTTSYVSTMLQRGVITPLNTPDFVSMLFSSDILEETLGESELEYEAAIVASGGTPLPRPEIDRAQREAAFEDILRTVTWTQE